MAQKTALISGAGIAGPAAAYWLTRAGWKTTIVEQSPEPRQGGYVIDFWGLGYDLAERMGLLPAIQRVGYHAREIRVVGDRGQRLSGFGGNVFDALTNARYVTVARSDLSRLLLQAAAPSTELLFGDEITALSDPGAGGVTATLQSGTVRRFDLVIGADGLHSGVRRLAFGPEARFERSLGYAVAAFETRGYAVRDPDVYVMYGRPGRMLGRFTQHDDRTLLLFVFAHEGAIPEDLQVQKALVAGLYRDGGWETPAVLRALEQAESLYLDSVSQIVTPAWSAGPVALVGDAAFCVSLMAGQGSALAMVAAYVLAGELSRAGDRTDQALEAYERRLRAWVETKQAAAKRFAGAFAPRTRFGLWFRNLVIQAMGIPGLARMGLAREITDSLSLPDYGL